MDKMSKIEYVYVIWQSLHLVTSLLVQSAS